MPGGLLQLVITGQQDQYITQNPQISYFKYVYKRHTKFAMESIRLEFLNIPRLEPTGDANYYRCNISRHGDLLSNVYFCFTLPNIYSSDKYKFRWIENIGNMFVKKATINVGGQVIDSLVGEWLCIWNELTLKDNGSYSRLIGNVPELISPTLATTRIGIRNNKFYYIFYPASDYSKGEAPSIKAKTLYVPLNFWFTRNPALALPLLKLQLVDVYITIYTESSENLYQVWSDIVDTYVSPTFYNELHDDDININTFAPIIVLNAYIDANYIFLENSERDHLLLLTNTTESNQRSMQYLVEQVIVSTETAVSSTSSAYVNVNININRHAKEIIWTLRRNDYKKFNIYNNYTAGVGYDEYKKIIKEAALIWNNIDANTRIAKDADYFSFLQPYQHHTNVPRVGIYCYSFALFPEKVNPTGSFNGSVVNTKLKLLMDGTHKNEDINEKLRLNQKPEYEFEYLLTTYTITMNIFQIIGGNGGLKFA
jgi:hypothetical protein